MWPLLRMSRRRKRPCSVSTPTESCEVRLLAAGTTVWVDSFGADPLGRVSSTAAIQAAIDAAGEGGTVLFTRKGVYLNTGSLVATHAGQTWQGRGATLRRADQISTTTLSDVTAASNTTTVRVADASQFRVGMEVNLLLEGRYDSQNHRILAIDGQTLTLGTEFSADFAAGATLFTSFTQIVSRPTIDGFTLTGMSFDGNRTRNTILSRWELHSEIYVAGRDLTLSDLIAKNAQAEGFSVGGQNVTMRNISSINSNGNGIHFSGIRHYTATNLRVVNANLLGITPGHADGGVIWSNDTEYGTLDGVYVENAIAGLGSLDSPDNSNMTIRNVTVINCRTIVDMVVPGVAVGNITIENLVSRNDSEVAVVMLSNAKGFQRDGGPHGIVLRNWKCENARLFLRGVRDVQVLGCQFKVRLPSTNAVATIELSENVTIDALLQGGRYGLATSAQCRRITVRGQIVDNQWGGVYLSAGEDVLLDRLSVTANAGRVDSQKYTGIVLGNGTRAIGGRVKMASGIVGVSMPLGNPAVPGSGAVLEGMIVATPAAAMSVSISASAAGNRIMYCRTTKPIPILSNGLNRIEQNNLL